MAKLEHDTEDATGRDVWQIAHNHAAEILAIIGLAFGVIGFVLSIIECATMLQGV